jgi:DNA-binding LacI/PurR family transcriptional regulator/AraC-like DNA-binding protein
VFSGAILKEYRIAAILPVESEFSSRLLDGALEYSLGNRSIKLLDRSYSRENLPQFDGGIDFDAAITWANREDRWIQDLKAAGLPVINTSADWYRESVHSVCYHTTPLFEAVIDHLSACGMERIAYINFSDPPSPAQQGMIDMFLAVADRRDIAAELRSVGDLPDFKWQDHEVLITDDIEAKLSAAVIDLPKPIGVCCSNDYLGYHFCRIADEMGFSIPEDFAVMGMIDYRIARFSTPPLTTVPMGAGLGSKATELLLQWLSEGREPPIISFIDLPPIICRESTGGGTAALGYMQKAMKLIQEQACEGLTVARLAKLVGVSPQTLNTKFVESFGHPPGEAIRRVRVNNARHYLSSTNASIAEVAGMCGFNQQSKFTIFFKRETGMTPMAYRKSGNAKTRA